MSAIQQIAMALAVAGIGAGQGLAQEGMTMLVVTHEMAFARDVADRLIFMDGGVIVEQGPAREVIDNPKQERTRHFLARYAEQ